MAADTPPGARVASNVTEFTCWDCAECPETAAGDFTSPDKAIQHCLATGHHPVVFRSQVIAMRREAS